MRYNNFKKPLLIFIGLILVLPFPLASVEYAPPIVSYLLTNESTDSSTPEVPEFDPTVVPIPLNGAYHGVATLLDNAVAGRFTIDGRLQAFAEFEQAAYQTATNTRRVAFDRVFYRWNNILRDDNVHPYILQSAALGRIPVASVAAREADGSAIVCPDGTGKLPWPCIAEGNFDTRIIDLAQKIRDSGIPQFVFSFNHEPEDEIRCGANDTCMGTAEDYVAAWRRVVNLFREQQADNVDFMWITRGTIYGATVQAGFPTADEIYPGDDYIDWIAADIYNFSFRSGGDFNWRPLSEVAGEFYEWGSQRPKPLAFGEWGSREEYFNPNNDGSRKAAWFDDARTWLKTEATKVKAVMYFNLYVEDEFRNPDEFGNTGPDWRIDTTQKSLEAYQRLAQDPYFIGIDG